jgi:hypothetical protein
MLNVIAALTLVISTASCSSFENSEQASNNIACAFVEGYLDNKAFALKAVAEGKSARDDVDFYLSDLSNQLVSGSDASAVFAKFLGAMQKWASEVDYYQSTGDLDGFSIAAANLEVDIDSIEKSCIDLGWKFKSDWR